MSPEVAAASRDAAPPVPGAGAPPSAAKMVGGAAIGIIGRVGYAVLAYVNTVFAARLLGAADFGLFTLAVTTVTTLTVMGAFGADNSVLALVPRYLVDDVGRARRVLAAITRTVLAVSTGTALVLLVFPGRVAVLLGQPEARMFVAVTAVSLPFAALQHVTRAAAQSVHAYAVSVLTGAVLQAALFQVFLTAGVAGGLSRSGVVWAFTASFVIAGLVGAAAITRLPTYRWTWLDVRARAEPGLRALTFRFLVIHVFTNLRNSAVYFVLGQLVVSAQIGVYGAAQRTANLVSFVMVGIGLVFSPQISAAWARRDLAALDRLYRVSTKWALAVSLPICVWLIVAAPGVLSAFGRGFRGGAAALAWLAVGQAIFSGTGPGAQLLMLTGQERTMMWSMVAVTATSVVVAWVVVPLFGVSGAAAVTGVLGGLFNVALLLMVRKRMGLVPYDRTSLWITFSAVVSLGAGAAVYRWAWAPDRPWLVGASVQTAVVLGSYALLFLWLGLSTAERHVLAGSLRRVLGRRGRA